MDTGRDSYCGYRPKLLPAQRCEWPIQLYGDDNGEDWVGPFGGSQTWKGRKINQDLWKREFACSDEIWNQPRNSPPKRPMEPVDTANTLPESTLPPPDSQRDEQSLRLGEIAYTTYMKTYNPFGVNVPPWEQIIQSPSMDKPVEAWIAVGKAVASYAGGQDNRELSDHED